MDKKPAKMPVKDWLIRNVAFDIGLSEDVVSDIVDHQSLSAREAMLCNNSVELSGFGKFLFSTRRAGIVMDKIVKFVEEQERILKEEDISEKKRSTIERKIKQARSNFEFLKSKK